MANTGERSNRLVDRIRQERDGAGTLGLFHETSDGRISVGYTAGASCRRHRRRGIAADHFGGAYCPSPHRDRARPAFNVGSKRSVENAMIGRLIADNIYHGNARTSCIVKIG
jgi:hypothetical protein